MSIMFGDFYLDAHTIVSVKFLFSVVTVNFSRQGSESHGKTVWPDKECLCFILSQ